MISGTMRASLSSTLLFGLVCTWACSHPAARSERSAYFVHAGALHDGCGEKVVLRGVNHPTIYVDREGAAFPEIAKTGANSVRIMWFATHGVPISAVEPALHNAVSQHMLPILELHDSTCAWKLDPIVSYLTSGEAVTLIKKHQSQLIVNLANEADPPDAPSFRNGYAASIQKLRRAGIHVPLMIDGARCGRDYRMLLAEGAALLAADPDHNLVFSAHLYDPLSEAELAQVFASFVRAKLAFVVGEFANRQPPGCGAPVDYRSIIAQAQRYGIGWLAWSWGDDDPAASWNSDCEEFDMTRTFAFDSLEGWGRDVAVTHEASILRTSRRPASLRLGRCY